MSGAAGAPLTIGVDVPWVTSWSGEQVTGVAPCPSVDGALAIGQAERPGEGRPMYSRNHLFRQRKSVREMRCPMCGEPTAEGDRWTQTGRWTTAGEIRAKGLGVWLPPEFPDDKPLLDAGSIAPLHRACAERALARCPHLKGLDDRELKAFPGAWIVAALSVEARPAHALANVPRKSAAAVSFLQLIGVPDHDAA
ncbi:hypothetical protein [Phenylobacterium sp.]|uniref:hypothetical protein n=1 Tax=Phenylobacterium sp. TaxID=1871053 RepID=UPI00356536B4